MKHVSYKTGVEFAENPPSLSANSVDGIVYLRFRRDVEAVERDVDGEPSTVYRATEYVATCEDTPGALERARANEAEWFDTVHEFAADALSRDARSRRDALLAASDPRTLEDFPQSEEARAAWLTYRQALRDIPGQAGFPFEVTWPEAPDE